METVTVLDKKITNMNDMFRTTLMFPASSFIDLVVSDTDKKKIKIAELKEDVLNYIKKHKRASIPELMDYFKITLDEAGLILKELEDDKQIVISD